jgi:hypothetical protein
MSGKDGQGRLSFFLSKVFLLYFLRTASLIRPESHLYQPCTHPSFRGRIIKELSYLKLVFCTTLQQSYKALQHKTQHWLSAISWRRTFLTKTLPSNSNLGIA